MVLARLRAAPGDPEPQPRRLPPRDPGGAVPHRGRLLRPVPALAAVRPLLRAGHAVPGRPRPGHRRARRADHGAGPSPAGRHRAVVGLAWALGFLLVVQPHLGDRRLAAGGLRGVRGHARLDPLGDAHPSGRALHRRVLADPNFALLVYLFAPVLFLPFLSPRYLLPVVPLQVLYLAGDVTMATAVRPAVGGDHRVHLPVHAERAEPTRSQERGEGQHRPTGAHHHGRGRDLVLRPVRAELDLRAAVGLGRPGRGRRRPHRRDPLASSATPGCGPRRRCWCSWPTGPSCTTSTWARPDEAAARRRGRHPGGRRHRDRPAGRVRRPTPTGSASSRCRSSSTASPCSPTPRTSSCSPGHRTQS